MSIPWTRRAEAKGSHGRNICKIADMAGSHEVMFTRPAELARKLTEAAGD
jgi:hypothetical protein